MCINIIKGVGALFLVFVICFIAHLAVTIVLHTPKPLRPEIIVAWIGTVPATFYMGTGFWRRLLAAFLGSIASLAIPYGINYWASAAVAAGHPEYSPVMLFGLQGYFTLLFVGQPAVAFFVAWAIVQRRKPARLAAA